MSGTPPVFMLTPPTNIVKKTTLSSIGNYKRKGYNVYPFQGVIRKTDRSKIVMDGWKKFFGMLKGNLPNGLLISEDDVLWNEPWSEVKKKVKMDKINWLCYQKFFKEKQKDGSVKEIPVGSQLKYIPPKMINKYKEELLKAKSIHFDRWNSRLKDIYYAYKPHEVCAEIESVSATTGKIRKGKKIENFNPSDIPKKLKTTNNLLKSFAGIPLINQRTLIKRFPIKK